MTTRTDGMSVVSRWAGVLVWLPVAIVGCSDLDGEVGTGGTGATGGTGGTDGTACPTGRFFFEFVENNPDGDDPPLADVESCLAYADTENCETSNAEGKLVHDSPPANEELTWAHEKEGYEGWISGTLIGENGFGTNHCPDTVLGGWVMYPDDDPERQALAARLETPYPWEGGIVTLGVFDRNGAPLGGVTFEPVGSTADEVGQVFYYDAETQQYSLDLEETSAAAGPLIQGGFIEVTTGVREFEVTGAVGDCYGPEFGWPSDAPNRIRVPVRAGSRTGGTLNCDPP